MNKLETGTEHLLAAVEDGVGLIAFNRPEARNALTPEMIGCLNNVITSMEQDIEVRCVVLTGSGGSFCAGGDVKGMASKNDGLGTVSQKIKTIDQAIHKQRLDHKGTAGRLHTMAKPTIALVDGPAAGAGMSLAMACDLRMISERAFFTTAFAKVGFSGDYGGTYFLTQLVGSAKARELYYLSERVSSKEALALGLTNWVCKEDELETKGMELAHRLANGPSVALGYMKENLNRAMMGDIDECLDMEATHHIHCGQTEDHKNATKAFVEKKEPVFKGE